MTAERRKTRSLISCTALRRRICRPRSQNGSTACSVASVREGKGGKCGGSGGERGQNRPFPISKLAIKSRTLASFNHSLVRSVRSAPVSGNRPHQILNGASPILKRGQWDGRGQHLKAGAVLELGHDLKAGDGPSAFVSCIAAIPTFAILLQQASRKRRLGLIR